MPNFALRYGTEIDLSVHVKPPSLELYNPKFGVLKYLVVTPLGILFVV